MEHSTLDAYVAQNLEEMRYCAGVDSNVRSTTNGDRVVNVRTYYKGKHSAGGCLGCASL